MWKKGINYSPNFIHLKIMVAWHEPWHTTLHTHNAVKDGVADFSFALHINLDGHQHRMDIKLEGDHSVDF